MSIFSNIFGSSENQNEPVSNVDWISLTDLGQIEEIMTISTERPVLIFKSSATCGISRFVLKQFEKEFDLNDRVTSYFLDLLAYRAVSNAVATRFGVTHESPQLLLIQDGKSVYDVSHSAIEVEDLRLRLNP